MIVARVIPGIVSRATLVASALVLAAAIGLSRIFLRVHYWSDVAGGWALGAGIFGLCAAVALIVAYMRKDDRTQDESATREESHRADR